MRHPCLAALAMLLLAGCVPQEGTGPTSALPMRPGAPATAIAVTRMADPPPPDLASARTPSRPIPGFRAVIEEPVSTIPLGADTASWGITRRMLRQGRLPPPEAVRPEEFLNAFAFSYPAGTTARPLNPTVAVFPAPWDARRRLLHIGIRSFEAPRGERPPLNLTFLIDASVSMFTEDRVTAAIAGIRAILPGLGERDRISIVTYASGTRSLLAATSGARKPFIEAALDDIRPSGGTMGLSGIDTAYELAGRNLAPGSINRVILITDGDYGLGAASPQALEATIRAQRSRGIRLTAIGMGLDNPADTTLRGLAHAGGGIHAFAADAADIQRILTEEFSRNVAGGAQSVRVEVEFNGFRVQEYRLVGYSSRALSRADFEADQAGADDIAAGRAITAVFELASPVTNFLGHADPLRAARATGDGDDPGNEYAILRIRHGNGEVIRRAVIERDARASFALASADNRFAASIAGFALMLRRAESIAWPYADIATAAAAALGENPDGQRPDFVATVRRAATAR
jgi:Ca-activated chloride channel family protein